MTALQVGNNARLAVRVLTGVIGLGLVWLAVGLWFRWPWATGLWPWPDYYGLSPLSYAFLCSIAASIAAPMLWIALTDRLHAAAPGAMNMSLILAGSGGFMLQSYLANPQNQQLLYGALVAGLGLVSIVAVYAWGRHLTGTDKRPLPAPVYWSFWVFIVVLVVVGILLVRKTPNVIPWSISPEASVIYGWIFLGASVYFIFAVFKPLWENAAGQLIGFLVYDLVLIVPFLRHFGDVAPEHFWGLVIYTAVVIYSGLLAIWYLFVDRDTRFGAPEAA